MICMIDAINVRGVYLFLIEVLRTKQPRRRGDTARLGGSRKVGVVIDQSSTSALFRIFPVAVMGSSERNSM